MVKADMVVTNAKVMTVDRRDTVAEALAIKGERILAVGRASDMEPLIGSNTRCLDAGGKTVLPGFIDAHAHLLSVAGRELLLVDCSKKSAGSIPELIELLRRKARRTPEGQWIRGCILLFL